MVDLQGLVDTLSALDEESLVAAIGTVLQARPEVAPPLVTFAVPDLTYPPAKVLTERRAQGVIKSFNTEKGFGFIDCPDLHAVFGNDVFLHNRQLGHFMPGNHVSFAVVLNKDNKPQAYDLMAAEQHGKAGGPATAQQLMAMLAMKGAGKLGGPGGHMGMGKGPGCCGGGGKGKMPGPAVGKPDEQTELGVFTGTIKSFNPNNGYGFIECPHLKAQGYANDVFLHHQQLAEFSVGDVVNFLCYLNSKGQPQARNLQAADPGAEAVDPLDPWAQLQAADPNDPFGLVNMGGQMGMLGGPPGFDAPGFDGSPALDGAMQQQGADQVAKRTRFA